MERRLPPVRALTFGSICLALLISMPWLGWWPLPILAAVVFCVFATDRHLAGSRQPEYRVLIVWLLSVAAIGYASLQTEGLRSPLTPWFAIPAVALAVRFRLRGVITGIVLTAAVLGAMAISTPVARPVHLPTSAWLAADITLVISTVGYTMTLLYVDLQNRDRALVDPLTGLLNRHALHLRLAELAEQARFNSTPISFIIGDIDHFKQINDTHGHELGDQALQAVAAALRAHLRAYDLAYRLGGEEFLVVLPGTDRKGALFVAERLRGAITKIAGFPLPLTMSFGVASAQGGSFDYRELIRRTDNALYRAKASGRNRVIAEGDSQPGAAANDPQRALLNPSVFSIL
jgi:diguanylate cyclase (GGDEF)-like protein